ILRDLFGLNTEDVGEEDGEEEKGEKRPQLPAPSAESTADQPPEEQPPTPPDPTVALPTPEELANARRKAIEKGGGKLVEVTRPERKAFPDAGTELNLREGEIVAAEVARTGRPLGFKNVGGVDEFRQFKDRLLSAVLKGLTDVQIGIRGSSIHGNAFNKQTGIHDGAFFDTKRRPDGSTKRSDRDLFIVSPALAKRAEEAGILRRGENWVQLESEEIRELGLNRLADMAAKTGVRKITFRLFASEDVLKRETSYIIFARGK
ncbi:MAG: hypothetical protein GY953_38380, partial [bacterium]|nr:hypothetical protein [bacterium]